MTASADPPATLVVNGSRVNSVRATKLYSYDTNNNLIAYCDAVWTHNNGLDWSTRPNASDSLCPNGKLDPKFAKFTWTATNSEPFGELTKLTLPSGYNYSYLYQSTFQGGTLDYGLPTQVTGDNVSQSQNLPSDPTQITPQKNFVYDPQGNLVCYSAATGNYWILEYDSIGRLLKSADPDDDASVSGIVVPSTCPKTGYIAKTNATTTHSYYVDGEVASEQTPSEDAAGVSATFNYDADGNESQELSYEGYVKGSSSWVPGYVNKVYDADDRLVEVKLDRDPSDGTAIKWTQRYLYDLTHGGSVAFLNSTGIKAYGNLFKTQLAIGGWTECIGEPPPFNCPPVVWNDIKGSVYDALDRPVRTLGYLATDSKTAVTLQSAVYDNSP